MSDLTPQGVLAEMLLKASEFEGVLVVGVYKDGRVRTGWSEMSQIMRLGAIKALELESDAAWGEEEEVDVE